MIATPELIALLAASARPVQRLRPPLVRTGLWLLLAAGVFVLLALATACGRLRHAALLRPTAVTRTGSVAVAAMTATALSLFHALDATIMILVWNLGLAAMIVGLGGVLGLRTRSA